jgi:hypothetical protein
VTITDYLTVVKQRLLTDPVVAEMSISRERATESDGHLRAQVILADQSRLEFSEYVQVLPDGQVAVVTYSYNWLAPDHRLIRRWDNTPHYPHLPGFPHHIHEGDPELVTPGRSMSIFAVLDEIARRLA